MDVQNARSRNVLIDRLVFNELPDLRLALARHRMNCQIQVFEFRSAPASISEAAKLHRPDLIVVDAAWLHLTHLLDRIMDLAGCRPVTVVVASRQVDEVFKVKAAHRGFTHHLDLDEPADSLVEKLCSISVSATTAFEPHRWDSVPFPSEAKHHGSTARDVVDREILDLVSVGMQDADIAAVVHTATQTVKNRISAMLDRSGYRNRTQLAWMHSSEVVAEAMIRGLSHQA